MQQKSIIEYLNSAENHYKNEKYLKAIESYQTAYELNFEAFNDDDKELYAKALYYGQIKKNKKAFEIEAAGHKICQLVKQKDCSNNDKQDDIYTIAISAIMSFYHNKNGGNTKTLKWCDKLNKNYLSKKPFSGENGNINPSRKEKWYLAKTKALLKTKQYENTIELVSEALEELDEFTYNSDIWLKYRRAEANEILENFDEAIKDFEEVKKRDPKWYVESHLGECYFFKGNNEIALEYLIEAALNDDKIIKKINVYNRIGMILENKGYIPFAVQHYYLSYVICKHQEDNSRLYKFQNKIEYFDLDFENTDFEKVERELRPVWINYKFQNIESNKGKIKKIFKHEPQGILSCNDGKSYTFYLDDFEGSEEELLEGIEVTFYLDDNLNPIHIMEIKT